MQILGQSHNSRLRRFPSATLARQAGAGLPQRPGCRCTLNSIVVYSVLRTLHCILCIAYVDHFKGRESQRPLARYIPSSLNERDREGLPCAKDWTRRAKLLCSARWKTWSTARRHDATSHLRRNHALVQPIYLDQGGIGYLLLTTGPRRRRRYELPQAVEWSR